MSTSAVVRHTHIIMIAGSRVSSPQVHVHVCRAPMSRTIRKAARVESRPSQEKTPRAHRTCLSSWTACNMCHQSHTTGTRLVRLPLHPVVSDQRHRPPLTATPPSPHRLPTLPHARLRLRPSMVGPWHGLVHARSPRRRSHETPHHSRAPLHTEPSTARHGTMTHTHTRTHTHTSITSECTRHNTSTGSTHPPPPP